MLSTARNPRHSLRHNGSRLSILLGVFTVVVLTSHAALAATRIAVIDNLSLPGEPWCTLLETEGWECVVLPSTGPEGSLDAYDVVIDLSDEWTDPEGLLGDHMRAGKAVITKGIAPFTLGIDSDPTVQAWIGANVTASGYDPLVTLVTDPILGTAPPGTVLGGDPLPVFAIEDTSGHANAKVLARYQFGSGPIGLLRNTWEGGQSVYFGGGLNPTPDFLPGSTNQLILRTVRVLTRRIPTVSDWGLVILALLLLTAGSLVALRRKAVTAA